MTRISKQTRRYRNLVLGERSRITKPPNHEIAKSPNHEITKSPNHEINSKSPNL